MFFILLKQADILQELHQGQGHYLRTPTEQDESLIKAKTESGIQDLAQKEKVWVLSWRKKHKCNKRMLKWSNFSSCNLNTYH